MLRTVALLVLVGVSYAAPAMQSVSLRRRQQSTCTDKEATKFVDSLPSELGCKVNACSAWGGIKVKCSIPLDTMTKIPLYGALVEAKLEFDFTFHACSQPAGMSIFFGAVALDSATEVLKLAYSKLHIKKEVTTAKSETFGIPGLRFETPTVPGIGKLSFGPQIKAALKGNADALTVQLSLITCGTIGTTKKCLGDFTGLDKVFPFKIADETLNFGDFCKTTAPTPAPTTAAQMAAAKVAAAKAKADAEGMGGGMVFLVIVLVLLGVVGAAVGVMFFTKKGPFASKVGTESMYQADPEGTNK